MVVAEFIELIVCFFKVPRKGGHTYGWTIWFSCEVRKTIQASASYQLLNPFGSGFGLHLRSRYGDT
jgi:hypothetical protein